MNILGISCFFHDSAACLVQNGNIIAAAQEERFTRKKHDSAFPKKSIEYCLQEAGIQANDIDIIAFYEKPFIKFERLLETYMAYAPIGARSFIKAMPLWIKQKLWIKDQIRKELKFDKKIIFTEHHESHAAASFLPSPFQEAAFLTMDGVGEWATASYGVGKDNNINIMAEMKFPHSLGLLYSAFTYYTGFKVNSDEYKVMGLAPYGKPVYKNIILSELIDLKEDGSFKLNMKYFDHCVGLTMTNKRFERLFGGPPRLPGAGLTRRDMDLASSIQEVTEDIILLMAKHVYEATGQKRLCLAGGVSLNCVSNGRVLREGPFEDIWIQPAAGDAGCALGAALFAWYQYLGNKRVSDGRNDIMKGAYLGPKFDDHYISDFIKRNNIPAVELHDDNITEKVADLIAGQKVIGWFRGRMEFGPRALGARSIIADARSPAMQQILNKKIKFRESFRPFAPSIIEERVSDYFELEKESPYMLLVAPIKKEVRKELSAKEQELSGIEKLNVQRSIIPAVTHVDYSARIHTVSKSRNLPFYNLINKFNEKYGCPLIVNTSFNIKDEPIVCTPEDAYSCFMRTQMDNLVLGNFLLDKNDVERMNKNIGAQKRSILKKIIGRIIGPDISLIDLRKFGITMCITCGSLTALFFIRKWNVYPYFSAVSIAFLFCSLIAPLLLKPLYNLSMIFGYVVRYMTANIVLATTFYCIATPVSVLARLTGKVFLDTTFNKEPVTYWHSINTKRSLEDYEHQY